VKKIDCRLWEEGINTCSVMAITNHQMKMILDAMQKVNLDDSKTKLQQAVKRLAEMNKKADAEKQSESADAKKLVVEMIKKGDKLPAISRMRKPELVLELLVRDGRYTEAGLNVYKVPELCEMLRKKRLIQD
jgi:hypothetical protein